MPVSYDRRLLAPLALSAFLGAHLTCDGAERHWNVASGNTSNPASWSPFGVPVATDDVVFGEAVPSATGAIDADMTVGDLYIKNDSHIAIFDPEVTVFVDYLSIDSSSSLFVSGFTGFGDVRIDGTVWLPGSLFLSQGNISTDSLSSPSGSGLIEGEGLFFTNGGQWRGTLRAEGGPLFFRGNGTVDLDGVADGNTILDVLPGAELIVQTRLTDPFSGSIDIAPGGRLVFEDAGIDILVDLVGTSEAAAELVVESVVAPGHVHALAGLTRFEGRLENFTHLAINPDTITDAKIINEPGSQVDVNGTLRFDGTSDLNGGLVFGDGSIDATPTSFVRVFADTVLDFPNGAVALGDTFVIGDRELTVYAAKMTTGDPAVDGYEGTFDNFGTVTINTPASWRMGGVFEFDSQLAPPELHGSRMVVTDGGVLRTVGVGGLMTAPLKLLDGASVELDTDSVLQVSGQCVYSGGTISGAGTLDQLGDVIVDGNVLIASELYDWDGSNELSTLDVRSDGHLTINSLIDARDTSIRLRGILNVASPWFMRDSLIAHAASSIQGGQLTLLGGTLDAAPGNALAMSVFARLRVDGTAQIVTDPTCEVQLHEHTFFSSTTGTVITGNGAVRQIGDLDVETDATIDCARYDWDGQENSTTIVRSGAQLQVFTDLFEIFVGADHMSGTIILEPDASLVVVKTGDSEWIMNGTMTLGALTSVQGTDLRNTGLVEGAGDFFGMDVVNSGTMAPEGEIQIWGDYTQTSNGVLDLEIGGPVQGVDYDTLDVTNVIGGGDASIDGTLRVRLVNGYVPALGAVFEVLRGDSGVTGTFTTVEAPGFFATYLSDRVLLSFVGLPACDEDIDGDGEVNFGDLLAVLAAWGPCAAPCDEDLDGDGFVDFSDLLAVLSSWGSCS